MNTENNFEPATQDEKLFAIHGRRAVKRVVDGTTFELRYRFNVPPVAHRQWTVEDWVKYIDGPDGRWEWRVQA